MAVVLSSEAIMKLLGFDISQKRIPAQAANPKKPIKVSPTRRHRNAMEAFTKWWAAILKEPKITPFQFTLNKLGFKKAYINRETGRGLVSTRAVKFGTVVLAENIISIRSREKKKCKTVETFDELIRDKVMEMGLDWHREFMELPNTTWKKDGFYGGAWKKFSLPMVWDRYEGDVLGLNLAWVNHSCIPNCHLTFVNKFVVGEDGESKRVMGQAVIRACRPIAEGEEITVGYFYAKGPHGYRKMYTQSTWGFKCACVLCLNPEECPQWEEALTKYQTFDFIHHWPRAIAIGPATIYRSGWEALTQLKKCRINDLRVTSIWIKCAMVAAYHSDFGRATCFLTRARKVVYAFEGPTGVLYNQMFRWTEEMSLIPGACDSTLGLSARLDSFFLFKYQEKAYCPLFMLDAGPAEYIRLNRYRPIPEAERAQRTDDKVFYIASEKKDTWPRGKIPEHIEARKKPIPTENTANDHGKAEVCVNPEKDFLDLWRGLVEERLSELPPRNSGKSEKDKREDRERRRDERFQYQLDKVVRRMERKMMKIESLAADAAGGKFRCADPDCRECQEHDQKRAIQLQGLKPQRNKPLLFAPLELTEGPTPEPLPNQLDFVKLEGEPETAINYNPEDITRLVAQIEKEVAQAEKRVKPAPQKETKPVSQNEPKLAPQQGDKEPFLPVNKSARDKQPAVNAQPVVRKVAARKKVMVSKGTRLATVEEVSGEMDEN